MALKGQNDKSPQSQPADPAAGAARGLDGLAQAARSAAQPGDGESAPKLPPVHLWNPPHCGDIGMRIARDGTWFYQGSPIGRPALVKLFASILRKDADGHVLVTPVEKVSVEVEDAPFLAVALTTQEGPQGRTIVLRTNVDDTVRIDASHPLRFEPGPSGGVKPYALVRGDLWALATRALLHDLVELGDIRPTPEGAMFGVESAGVFFPIAPASAMDGLSG